jgi:serine/threonine-protein kinase RsbW
MSAPSSSSSSFSRQLNSRAPEIAELADAVEEWAATTGVQERTIRYVNIILDELIANIVAHAYRNCNDGIIEVNADYDGHRVCVTLRDYGPEFDPTSLPPADTEKDIDEREIGGLGVHFVRKLADHLSYQRHDGVANVVVFCKAEASPESGPGTGGGN